MTSIPRAGTSAPGDKVRILATGLLLGAVVAGVTPGRADQLPTSLEAGFRNPPNSAHPRVWWHWMNGNITKDGIRKDIEWMARIGIGGLQNFDVQLMTPKIVEHRLAYMTPEWKDAFHYAAELADQHGLELGIASSPGWSESGAPWVQPRDAMKKLVWSETTVVGGQSFAGHLAPPPTTTGPYLTVPKQLGMELLIGRLGPPPVYYGDVAVLAYPMPPGDEPPLPRLSSGTGQTLDAARVAGEDLTSSIAVARAPAGQPTIVNLEYDQPQTIRSASVLIPSAGALFGPSPLAASLEVADSALGWRKLADVPLDAVPTTVSFAPVTATRFRLVVTPAKGLDLMEALSKPPPGVAMSLPVMLPTKSLKIAELRLSREARVNAFELKAGFAVAEDYYGLDDAVGPEIAGIAPASVVDLTSRLAVDGSLDWTPPLGRWKILRFGYSLIGTLNHPATAEATGLETDKYDGAAVRRYMDTYLDSYAAVTGPALFGRHGLRAVMTDSIEVGPSNWTPNMIAKFRQLRGYDPRPWMPALSGVIVGSRRASDAFLYDFRRTLAHLLASEHYGQLAASAHAHGLRIYGEALESDRPVLGDDMTMRKYNDVVSSALWTYNAKRGPNPAYLADMKGGASVAHIYGQNLVSAESLTSSLEPWAYAPSGLKGFIDLEFDSGVNLPIIHTSVHQPVDDKIPGLSLLFFGQYFNRHETWAEFAKPWVDYIARNAYLLQQGRNVADVAYFFGEEAPLTALYETKPVSDAPVHYEYDFVNADALLAQLMPSGGQLVSAGGARYRVLYLGGTSRRMTLPVLRRLAQLADAGITIVGTAPEGSPSLKDDKKEYAVLIHRLWSGQAVTRIGQGRVFASHDVESALGTIGVAPDVTFATQEPDSDIRFVHRHLPDGDIYFVNNRKDRSERVEARFRVAGKAPEIWHADSGTVEPVSYRIEGSRTIVPLEMLPEDASFLVFRKPSNRVATVVIAPTWTTVAQIQGPWDVAFQPDRGAPAAAHFAKLQSWSENADPSIKYFSGVATYRKDFIAPEHLAPGAPLVIDLGNVADIAQVFVNGKDVGYAWKAPYRVDAGAALHAGNNTLEVRVADRWINRLIGDAQPGAKKITYTSMPTYRADAQLVPSGLIGPVTLMKMDRR